MSNVFDYTSSTWRAFVKAFKDDLAHRVERNLDQQTTLAALDLRPACPHTDGGQGGEPCRRQSPHQGAPPRCADERLPPAEAAASGTTGAKAAPASATGAGRMGSARLCGGSGRKAAAGIGGVSSTVAVFAARALSPLETAPAAGPSPDGVLSPVSPPSSRRSSLSTSALGRESAQSDLRLTSESSSAHSEAPAVVTVTAPNAAAPSAPAMAATCSGCEDQRQRPGISIHIHAQGSQRNPSRCQTQPGREPAAGASPDPGPAAEAEAAQAAAAAAAAAAPAAAASPPPQSLRLPNRRPATLRLRCIVRDPHTSSMLATARGHVDDPDIVLRRPRGRLGPQPVDSAGGNAAGCFEEPGHLLFVEEQVLGRGAFGFVTLVTDAVTENSYALKRLRRSAVRPMHVMQEQQAIRLLMRDQLAAPGPGVGDLTEGPDHKQGKQQEHQKQQAQEPQASGAERAAGVCSRCGGVVGPAPGAAEDGSTGALSKSSSSSGFAPSSSSAASGTQRLGSRCCAAAAAAAGGGPQRPCQCRFCTSGIVAAAAAGPTRGAARAAWMAKQQARALHGLQQPQPLPQQQRAALAQSASAQRLRQQAPEQEAARRCLCRQRRGPSFCVRQLGTFQDEQYLYLLMEHCPGGDLDRLVRSMARKTLVPRSSWLAQVLAGPAVAWRGLPEAAARFYAAGMLLALEELHSHWIVYRDLKPSNVLIDGSGYPQLADFGMAKVLDGPMGRATSACGTLDYMAPEIVKLECEQLAREGKAQGLENWVDSAVLRKGAEAAAAADGAGDGGRRERPAGRARRWRRDDSGQGSYGLGVDWWSYGAVLYVLLTGCKPFCPPEAEAAGEDPTRVLVRIINPWYEVPLPIYLSPAAKDLLRRLLVRQPKWRLGCGGTGAAEVRAHPFFAGFDWEAFEERRMEPPYPAQAVSLPHEQEAESVACFFGFYGSSVLDHPQPPKPTAQGQPQQPDQGPDGQGSDVRRRPALPANWLQDF